MHTLRPLGEMAGILSAVVDVIVMILGLVIDEQAPAGQRAAQSLTAWWAGRSQAIPGCWSSAARGVCDAAQGLSLTWISVRWSPSLTARQPRPWPRWDITQALNGP